MATAGSTPVDYLGKKFGYVVLARAYDLFSYPNTGLVAERKKNQGKPRSTQARDQSRHQGQSLPACRIATARFKSMMQWMRIDKDTATATYDGSVKSFNDDGSVSEAGLRIAIDEAKKSANISREIAFNEVADFTVLREAQKEMGVK